MKSNYFYRLLVLGIAWLSSATTLTAAETITLKSLLEEITQREVLAEFPSPRYECKQFSSYDRESTNPEDQEAWFANFDRSHFLRIDDREGSDEKEYVMMDADGPGAIVRLWGTWHGPQGQPFSNGTIRVYLDGQSEPAIEGPIKEIIDGGMLAGAPLSQGVAPQTGYNQQGHNLYLPIPYAKHCKVTYSTAVPVDPGARTGEALYYQLNYRTYEPGTKVETFSMQRLAEIRPTLKRVQDALANASRPAGDNWQTASVEARLDSGETSKPIKLQGASAIRQLQIQLDAENLPQALRSTILRIEFDGEQTVWCPVGDFFGIGYKLTPYKTWYTRVSDDGLMSCVWVMPFEQQAKITLENVGDQPVNIKLAKATSSDWEWTDRSLHFYATWRELNNVDTRRNSQEPGKGAFDVNYVTVEGKGIYAGDTLTLHNGAPAWWGEGDEKIYVDGEKFPSHFGTGTEDYYGYAWCRPESFAAPFHAQPEGKGNLRGGFSVNSRYRALDAIPFTSSLRFDMEQWHWSDTKMNFAPATFFYARPGAKVNVEPDPKAAALPVKTTVPELAARVRVEGAIEGETLEVNRKTGGTTEHQHGGHYGWSGDEQLWWRDASVGDELEVSFAVGREGTYELLANLTKASDYAVIRVAVNDSELSEEIDRYDGAVAHDVVNLGSYDLKQGDNHLTVRLVGHNEKAIQRGMVGIDYLKLQPVSE